MACASFLWGNLSARLDVLLGNLERNFLHSAPSKRKAAIESAGYLDGGGTEVQLQLVWLLNNDPDFGVRRVAADTLDGLSIPALIAMLDHADPAVGAAAVMALSRSDNEQLVQHDLLPAAFDPGVADAVRLCNNADSSEQMRCAAIGMLGKLPSPALAVHARHTINTMLESSHVTVRKAAAETMGKLLPSELLPHVQRLLRMVEHDADVACRATAARSVGKAASALSPHDAEHFAAAFVRVVRNADDKFCRMQAVQALGRLGLGTLSPHVETLVSYLDEPSRDVRLSALEVLGRLTAAQVLPFTHQLARLADGDPDSA